MHPSASRRGFFHSHAFALALAIPALLAGAAGCSGGSEEGSRPPATAAPKASAPAPQASSPGEPAPAATAQADLSATKSAEVAPSSAAAPPTPAPSAAAARPDGGQATSQAAHDHDHADGDHDHPHPAETKSASALETPAAAPAGAVVSPETKAALAKAQAAAKLGDPASQEADPNSKAKLTYEFGTDNKNFGKCMQGDVLTHTFYLESSGEEDLVIKQAKPTCGCTVAQIAAQQADGSLAPYNFGAPIPPGRKVEITATLQTQNKRGHAASRINIFSNDPRGQTQLALEADVDPFFQVNPASLNFNSLSARDSATDKVTIATTRGEKVKLGSNLDNLPQGVKIELVPVEPDAEGKSSRWEIAAVLGPGLTEGNMSYSVNVRSDISIPGGEKLPTGHSPTYDVSVPVMARVTGMISYAPAFVSLGLIRPGQVVSRTIRVTSHDPEFQLSEPKVLVQGREGAEWELGSRFSTVIRPVPNENAIDVELRLDGMPETVNGSFAGTLDILVGHPEKPEVKLPITGVCRGGPVVQPTANPVPSNGTPQK